MKKILITGANSYIGTSFEEYMKKYSDEYQVDTIDMIDGTWRNKSFKGYDSIYHVAGIAHIKETKENEHLYYEINRDLAVETARKAKAEGVKQFIYLSSMSVYGMDEGVITKQTIPNPKTNYGKSKLQAEEKLKELIDDNFKIAFIRPPMVYGKGCKGNFQTVIKIVKKSPIFPKVNNKRSVIYIENLCSFIKRIIDEECAGLYLPQDKEYMNTSQMAKWIAEAMGKKVFLSSLAGIIINILKPFLGIVRKAFGTLIYKDTEDFDFDYCIVDTKKAVKRSI